MAQRLGLEGVVVLEVARGGPAAKAGLRPSSRWVGRFGRLGRSSFDQRLQRFNGRLCEIRVSWSSKSCTTPQPKLFETFTVNFWARASATSSLASTGGP
jgi:hypothetical protein